MFDFSLSGIKRFFGFHSLVTEDVSSLFEFISTFLPRYMTSEHNIEDEETFQYLTFFNNQESGSQMNWKCMVGILTNILLIYTVVFKMIFAFEEIEGTND